MSEEAYTPPTLCEGDTHAWPGEASTDPTPCVCGEKSMSVTYVERPVVDSTRFSVEDDYHIPGTSITHAIVEHIPDPWTLNGFTTGVVTLGSKEACERLVAMLNRLDPAPPEASSTPDPIVGVPVTHHHNHEITFSVSNGLHMAVCEQHGQTVVGSGEKGREYVEDWADAHLADTLRVRTANLGGGGA